MNNLENAKQMKSTTIENKLFSLSSLVFGTFDNDDGGSNDNVKHMHHHNNDCNGKSKKKATLMHETTALHVHHTFYHISLTFIARIQCEMS